MPVPGGDAVFQVRVDVVVGGRVVIVQMMYFGHGVRGHGFPVRGQGFPNQRAIEIDISVW